MARHVLYQLSCLWLFYFGILNLAFLLYLKVFLTVLHSFFWLY